MVEVGPLLNLLLAHFIELIQIQPSIVYVLLVGLVTVMLIRSPPYSYLAAYTFSTLMYVCRARNKGSQSGKDPCGQVL